MKFQQIGKLGISYGYWFRKEKTRKARVRNLNES